MITASLLLVFAIKSFVIFTPDEPNPLIELDFAEEPTPSTTFHIYEQKLDHFTPDDSRTFKQRYLVNDDFYNHTHTLFFYLNGEAQMRKTRADSGFAKELAKKHQALLIALEHRYYGESQPLSDHSTENLKYLTTSQALADAAAFLKWIVEEKKKDLDIRQVVVIGGSYAGSLSAWFRMLYPHLVVGSIASSAPVVAQEAFPEYDQHIEASLPYQCAQRVREASALIAEESKDPAKFEKLKAATKCTGLSRVGDFLYVVTDAVAHAVQYNVDGGTEKQQTIKMMCDTLAKKTDGKTLKDNMIDFFVTIIEWMDTTCLDYSSSYEEMSNITINPEKMKRQWYYQSCLEYGYFQTAPERNSLRPSEIDLEYHIGLCKELFGIDKVDVEATNIRFFADDSIATNVIWTNGAADPWMKLSITPEQDALPGQENAVIKRDGRVERQGWLLRLIQNGSHCTDLSTPSDADSPSLVAARASMEKTIASWIAPLDPLPGVVETVIEGEVLAYVFFALSFVAGISALLLIVLGISVRKKAVEVKGTKYLSINSD